MSSKEQTITIPLSKFVDSHLGRWIDQDNVVHHMWHSRPIDRDLAIIIFTLTDNKHTCYIQWADEMSPDLTEPVLWEFGAWQSSTDKWVRQKAYSDKQRAEREIFNENLKIVSKAYTLFSGVEGDAATVVAYKLLTENKFGAMKAFGVKELINKGKL